MIRFYPYILYSSEIYSEKNEDEIELRQDVHEFLSAYAAAYAIPRADFAILRVVFSRITAASSFESDTSYIPREVDYGSAIHLLVSGREACACDGDHTYEYSDGATGEKWRHLCGAD